MFSVLIIGKSSYDYVLGRAITEIVPSTLLQKSGSHKQQPDRVCEF